MCGISEERIAETIIHKTIKKHQGLTDWEDECIADEVRVIIKALKKKGFVIRKE